MSVNGKLCMRANVMPAIAARAIWIYTLVLLYSELVDPDTSSSIIISLKPPVCSLLFSGVYGVLNLLSCHRLGMLGCLFTLIGLSVVGLPCHFVGNGVVKCLGEFIIESNPINPSNWNFRPSASAPAFSASESGILGLLISVSISPGLSPIDMPMAATAPTCSCGVTLPNAPPRLGFLLLLLSLLASFLTIVSINSAICVIRSMSFVSCNLYCSAISLFSSSIVCLNGADVIISFSYRVGGICSPKSALPNICNRWK